MLMGFGDEVEHECGDINSMRFGERLPAGHGVDFDDVRVSVAAQEQIDAGDGAPTTSAARRANSTHASRGSIASATAPRLMLVRQSSRFTRRIANTWRPMTSSRRSQPSCGTNC